MLICERRVSAGYRAGVSPGHVGKKGSGAYVTEDGGGETGGNTTSERDGQLCRLAQRFLLFRGHTLERQLVTEFINGELRGMNQHLSSPEKKATPHLSDGVRNLFTDQRQEPGVQARETLGSCNLGQAGEHAGRVGRVRDEADTGGFHRCEEDVCEESVGAEGLAGGCHVGDDGSGLARVIREGILRAESSAASSARLVHPVFDDISHRSRSNVYAARLARRRQRPSPHFP